VLFAFLRASGQPLAIRATNGGASP